VFALKACATARAVARGQSLFNTKPIQITQVKGLNDDLHLPVDQGSCTTCHDAGNAGDHSYFHNGSAKGLNDVVDFYNQRFGVGFSASEKADLVAFLRTL
jgi:predicted CXXCH cytochrome family protein